VTIQCHLKLEVLFLYCFVSGFIPIILITVLLPIFFRVFHFDVIIIWEFLLFNIKILDLKV